MGQSMRVLAVSSQRLFPPDTGGANVIYLFLKYLSRKHEVHVVTTENTTDFQYEPSIRLQDILVDHPVHKFLNPITFLRFFLLLKNVRPDTVIIHFPWYGLIFHILKLFIPFRLVLHEQNVEYLRFQRTGASWWPLLKVYERWVCKIVDQVICVTEVDRDIFVNELGVDRQKTDVVIYGFDRDRFQRDEQRIQMIRDEISPNQHPIILFFGKLDYQPNAEALDIIRTHLAPGLSAMGKAHMFLIVGGPIPPQAQIDEQHFNVKYVGHQVQIADYIYAADFVIVPLTAGSGVRTKIIESIGCGKMVVSTSQGAEGIDESACGGLLKIEDDWELFVQQMEAAIDNGGEKKIPNVFLNAYDMTTIIDTLNLAPAPLQVK